jgi:hypothetical protein
MRRDTEPLEPIQQIVGQRHVLEESLARLNAKAELAIFGAFGKGFCTSFGHHGAGFRLSPVLLSQFFGKGAPECVDISLVPVLIRLSESSRKLPEVTTRSPEASP